MSFLVCFIIIISISISLVNLLNKKIEITIPISVMLIVLSIYPFGFVNRLDIGIYIVLLISVISIIYNIVVFIKNKNLKEIGKRICTPGLLIFFVFWIIFIVINKNRLLSNWDEFSHWGLIVKNMFIFNSYGTNPETIVMFRGYPPYTAIFEFFFLKIKGVYQEGPIIVASNILYISMVLPVFKNINWKKDLSKLLIYIPIIICLPVFFYSDFYTTIYVDAILGIFMAYTLYTYFSEIDEKTKYISICLSIISLPLIKSAGTGLAIIILIVILADILRCNFNKKQRYKYILILVLLIFCLAIGKYSWDLHLNATNNKAWDTSNITINNIISLAQKKGEQYQYTTIYNFIKQFFINKSNLSNVGLTSFSILVIYVFYNLFMLNIIKKNKSLNKKFENYKLSSIIILLGYILYMCFLLMLYVFTYKEYEAVRLASYDRYMCIYLIAIFMFNTFILLDNLREIKTDRIISILLIFSILVFMPVNKVKDFVNYKQIIQEIKQDRERFNCITKYQQQLEEGDKVYYISCGSTGLDFHISRYEMVPNIVDVPNKIEDGKYSWSLGEPRFEGDIWTKDITVQEFNDILINEKFSHVFIFKYDDIFNEKYGELFENSNDIKQITMYKVNILNGDVKLSEI